MAEMSNPVDVMGRELPYSQEAELAVIGSALTNSHSVAESVEILRPSDFYSPQNTAIAQDSSDDVFSTDDRNS